jgi:putative NADPH-quinone reductase
MRVLILYANPADKSFGDALHRQVIETLQAHGHETDDCDLYAEQFDPVLSRQERADYRDTNLNRARVASYADRLLAAKALVLVYPVWNEGFPAILKGFFDRIFVPGVSFEIAADGSLKPNLKNLGKLAAVCTYGAGRLSTFVMGDPPRRVVKRLLRAMPGHHISCDYVAFYGMNSSTLERRTAFMGKVKRVFEGW